MEEGLALEELIEELTRNDNDTIIASPVSSISSDDESIDVPPEDLLWLEGVFEGMFAPTRRPLHARENQRLHTRRQSRARPSVSYSYSNGPRTDVLDGAWHVLTHRPHLPHVFRVVLRTPGVSAQINPAVVHVLRGDGSTKLCLRVRVDDRARHLCTQLSETRTLSDALHILKKRLRKRYRMDEYHYDTTIVRNMR